MKRTNLKRKSTLKRSVGRKIGTGATKKRVVGKDAPKKKKPPTITKLKKELETLQKQIVLKLYGTDCFTCPTTNCEGKNRHLGHVPWPRTDLSPQAKFDYRYTRIQCMPCNIHKGGAGAKAYARMQADGIDMIMLREYADEGKGKPVPRSWFEEMISKYKALLEE